MPTRRSPSKKNAAVERQLAALRQIPAKIEAVEFMAQQFKEAGRPLSPEHINSLAKGKLGVQPPRRPVINGSQIAPGEGWRGFLVGVAVTATALSALWWLIA